MHAICNTVWALAVFEELDVTTFERLTAAVPRDEATLRALPDAAWCALFQCALYLEVRRGWGGAGCFCCYRSLGWRPRPLFAHPTPPHPTPPPLLPSPAPLQARTSLPPANLLPRHLEPAARAAWEAARRRTTTSLYQVGCRAGHAGHAVPHAVE